MESNKDHFVMKKIGYNPDYEATIKRIVNGERPFSSESIRLYNFYKSYIEQKPLDERSHINKEYLKIYEELPTYSEKKRKYIAY